jgi:hypothetical protein
MIEATTHPEIESSALISLSPDTPPRLDLGSLVDTSLTAQLADLTRQGLTGGDTMLLFTANSAIPVADTIRGSSEVLPVEAALGHIAADRNKALRYRLNGEGNWPSEQLAEIERLAKTLTPFKNVVVLDQYVHTGHTLQHAGQLLEAAGWQGNTYAVRGQWYQGVQPERVDTERLTSRNPDDVWAMHDIGREIGKAVYGLLE